MGHREDLLEGAKQCLYTKGYARTTARDIVAASGANLASIGYHYGSTEALLNAAMIQACEEWGDKIHQTLTTNLDPKATPLERFEATWTRVLDTFAEYRQLWVATMEATTQAEHAPEMRTFLTGALQQGREGLAMLFQNINAPVDEQTLRTVGSFYQALMTGVIVQWLIDPQHAPSSRDLTEALRIIVRNSEVTEGVDTQRDRGIPRGTEPSA